MAKQDVVWTRTADLQFVGILDYWVKRNKSPYFSKRLISVVSQRIKQIAENPFLYKSISSENIRTTSIGNYSIYYKITDKLIIIMAFWDDRQDPDKLLKILEG